MRPLLTREGVVTCPGIFPMIFTVLWRQQSKAAAIFAPILGMATGLAVWLGTAYKWGGSVSVSATGQVLPCVYGTVASAFSSIPYSIIITLFKPQNYDWNDFKKERLALQKLDSVSTFDDHEQDNLGADDNEANLENGGGGSDESKDYKRWGRIAAFWSIATFLGHWVIWPLPMYGSNYVFGKKVSSYPFCFLHAIRAFADSWVAL